LIEQPLEPRLCLAALPVISEVVSSNDGSLTDGDGVASDWIELYNAGDEALDLHGWYLTDDADEPNKWVFPATMLDAGGYLTVFASGRVTGEDRDPAGNLHTNFRLSADGEYVGLFRPDLTPAWQMNFPALGPDISYGIPIETATTTLVGNGSVPRVLVPDEGSTTGWTGGAEPFADELWQSGNGNSTGVGYSVTPTGIPGLVAEWLFETRNGTSVRNGQSAAGAIDETAGDPQGPYAGTASGTATDAQPTLHYAPDTPPTISSNFSLTFPAPETPANHVVIPLTESDALAQLPQGDFRVEAWFKTTDEGRSILTGTYVGAPTALNLELHTSNRGRIYVQGPNGTTDLNLTLPTNSRDGTWHHLAGVRRAGVIELHYDGQLVGSTSDLAGNFTMNKPELFLGRDHRLTIPFEGSLDNVRFYRAADTDIANLVAAYDFETSQGTPVQANQLATGQVDDRADFPGGARHGIGFATENMATGEGINYTADVANVLTDSVFAIALDEANRDAESFSIGMPPAVANLTTGDFTLQSWFKTRDTGRGILMGSFTGSDSALNLELHTDNRLRVYIQNANGGTTDLNVSVSRVGNSRDGQWHFATAVRRGDSVELYYDGELVGQTDDVAGPFVQSANQFFFGRDSRVADTRFDGLLDNIRFWDVALTPEQILAMAQGARPSDVQGGVFDRQIDTDIENQMRGVNASALIRIPFEVSDPTVFSQLSLRMKYDDGFVAYLNGRPMAARNAPDVLQWNSSATLDRHAGESGLFEEVFRGSPGDLLRQGTNILAIHGLNHRADATEFLIVPELVGISTTVRLQEAHYFPTPTPGEANGNGVLGFVAAPLFSVQRGFYDRDDVEVGGPLAGGVVLFSSTPAAIIRYTLDGSWPTASSGHVYSEPIHLETTTTLRAAAFLPGYASSPTLTQTYLFLEDVIRQPRNPGANEPNDPTYPLPFPLQHQPGVPADYEMDPRVVNHPLYANTIMDDLKSIPTMSLVMDMDDVFSQPNGIWSNSERRGLIWERLTSVEFFDPNDPTRDFHINSAIRMQGRASRVPSSSIKHAFRLIFKDEFGPDDNKQSTGGPTKLEFPLFDNSDVDRFDTVILRGGYNYSYLHGANDQNIRAQYIRERFMRETQLATGNLSARGTYVHLYVNGLYFGLYAPQERPDASFMAEHLGGSKEEYDVISAGEVRDGDSDAWNDLLTRAAADLSIDDNYQRAVELLDVDNLIDYMIVHIWGGTTDWPAPGGQFRNWVVGRKREAGAGFQFFVWDAEYSIQAVSDNRVNVNDANTPAYLYSRLRSNAEFRLRFADRVHRHFFNGGALTAAESIARYAKLANEIDRAIVAESARWGDTRGDACNPCLRDPLWVDERNWVLDTYMPQRSSVVLEQFQRADLYPELQAPVFSQHGGRLAAQDTIDLLSPASDTYREATLLASSASAELLFPEDDRWGLTWTQRDYTTTEEWGSGTLSIGFDTDGSYAPWIITDLTDQMFRQYKSAYLRVPFSFDTSQGHDELQIRARYDDGFIAYVNGKEVARSRNVPFGTPPLQVRPGSHEASEMESFTINLASLPPELLVDGENILAIHAINQSSGNVDFLFHAELVARSRVIPTTAQPIWYTLDGSDPRLPGGELNPAAQAFSGPFSLAGNPTLKARVYLNGNWSALTEANFLVDAHPIRFTEIYYHPSEPTAQEQAALPGVDRNDFEYIEIRNISATLPVRLDRFRIQGGVQFSFPDQVLAPGESVVVVENEAAFRQRFGSTPRVLGTWSGRLSNDGESLWIVDELGEQVLQVAYDELSPWPEAADGLGASLVLTNDLTPIADVHKASRWRASVEFGGSPGAPSRSPLGVVINEVIARTQQPLSGDAIELMNTTAEAIDISGWYLSDDARDPRKYRFPDGTVLGAREYLVVRENEFNHASIPAGRRFALNGTEGDSVWLTTLDDQGDITSFVDYVSFAATLPDQSLQRYPDGTGRMLPGKASTLGRSNDVPAPGPLILSEIHYHPASPSAATLGQDTQIVVDDLDFVEVYNPTPNSVNLSGWRIQGGIDFTFPESSQLAAGERAVIVSFDSRDAARPNRELAFRTQYAMSPTTRILGGYLGTLDQDSALLRLLRPDPTDSEPGNASLVLVDEAFYEDVAPWSVLADGGGRSLARIQGASSGNAASSWNAQQPSPGMASAPELTGDFDLNGTLGAEDIDLLFAQIRAVPPNSRFDLNEDGRVDARDRDYLVHDLLQTVYGDANLDGQFTSRDLVLIFQAGEYEDNIADNSTWTEGDWNGDGEFTTRDLVLAFQSGGYRSALSGKA
jgi:hypothetical protein